jgi:hypothetical protein
MHSVWHSLLERQVLVQKNPKVPLSGIGNLHYPRLESAEICAIHAKSSYRLAIDLRFLLLASYALPTHQTFS